MGDEFDGAVSDRQYCQQPGRADELDAPAGFESSLQCGGLWASWGSDEPDHIGLGGNAISDLRFLEGLHRLAGLTLANCRLTNVASLAALTNLNFLDVRQNRLTDISPLTNLLNLAFSDLRLNLLETSTTPL